MEPPICDYCGKDFRHAMEQGGLVKFTDYEALPEGMVGHPKGLAWFCDQHIESAQALSHLSQAEVLVALGRSDTPLRRIKHGIRRLLKKITPQSRDGSSAGFL